MKPDKKNSKIIYHLIFALYLIVNGILVFYHEQWRDEAQHWLLARDLQFWQLPGQMSYEGHSCMWHLLIYPFAHFGMPVVLQSIVAFVLVAIAVYLMIYRSPFSVWVKVIVVFSPILTYFYPSFARCYTMIPLLLFLLAMNYKDRHDRPWLYCLLIALLVQTHVVMLITAFMLSLCFGIEVLCDAIQKKEIAKGAKQAAPLSLPFISAVSLMLQLINVNSSSAFRVKTAGIHRTLMKIIETSQDGMEMLIGIGEKKSYALLLLAFVLLVVFVVISRKKSGMTVISVLVVTYLYQFWMYAMAYNYNHQRLITLILLMVWGCWILIADSKEKWDLLPQLGIAAICIFSLINLTQQMKEEINGMYSGGPEAATFINENIPADAVFITDNEPECSAILPFIKTKTFIYGGNGDEFSYVTWDDRWNQEIDYEGFNEIVRQYAQSGRPIYIISNWSWSCLDDPDRLQEDYELIFGSSENSVKGEEYYIYKVN